MAAQKQDEAQRYIDVALREINVGHYDSAVRLLNTAKSLYADAPVKELMEFIERMRAETTQEDNTEPRASTSAAAAAAASQLRQRRIYTNSKASARAEHSSSADYTEEQLQLVSKINKCTNYYQVLSVGRDAADPDIKKAYKKLALQLHPDKNRAPGAVEAFKLVANAMTVLTDSQKRKDYDATGGNSLSSSPHSAYMSEQHENNRYYQQNGTFHAHYGSDDISPEDLFDMFFGNYQPHGQRRRAYHAANQRQPQEHHAQPGFVFGLIMVLVLISLMTSFFTSDSYYSLDPSRKYPVRRETVHLAVPYFVKPSFENDYQGSLGRLENSVEEDYIYVNKQNCFRERSYRDAMVARARSLGGRAQFAQAQALRIPSCEKLSRIGITRYTLY